jgi:hypothetical protein
MVIESFCQFFTSRSLRRILSPGKVNLTVGYILFHDIGTRLHKLYERDATWGPNGSGTEISSNLPAAGPGFISKKGKYISGLDLAVKHSPSLVTCYLEVTRLSEVEESIECFLLPDLSIDSATKDE